MTSCIICYDEVSNKNKYFTYDKHNVIIHSKCFYEWCKYKSNKCIYCNEKIVPFDLKDLKKSRKKHNVIEHCNNHVYYRLLINAIDSYNYFELQKLATFVNKNKINIYETLIERNEFILFKFIYENGYEFDFYSDNFYLALEKKDFSVYILSKLSNDIIFSDLEKNEIMNVVIYNNNYDALIKLYYSNNIVNKINDVLFNFILNNQQYKILLFLFFHKCLTYNMYSYIIKYILIKLFILNIFVFIFDLYSYSVKRYMDTVFFH
jgi:hypothetical protein